MNRLSPLIVRGLGNPSSGHAGARSFAALQWQDNAAFDGAEPAKWLEELKLFATGWIGGLIFFGTYLS